MKLLQMAGAALVPICLVTTLSAQQPATLQLDREAGPARISVTGDPGYDYVLQSSTNLTVPDAWDFLATLNLSGDPQSWFDSRSSVLPNRFYRAVQFPAAPAPEAPDFRLVDQTGKSRQLRYYDGMASVPAVVLVFTGNGCAKLREMAPVIKSLASNYAPQGILVWLVDSNAGDNRSNILVEATSLGMSNGPPILHDPSQIVARSYHATTAAEAVAINTADWTIFYRGAIDDRLGSNAVATTQFYLTEAITAFLAGGAYSPRETRPAGCALNLNPPVAGLTYSADIAPLLQDRCVRCHSPGNFAPWSMTNYDVIHFYAAAIRESVLTGEMPPWHADGYYRSFTNDFSLRSDEAAKLIQWLDAGAPRGGGPDPLASTPPPATNYPYAWPSTMGQPDAILRIPVQNIPAVGTLDYRYITVVNTVFTNDVWLRAAIIKPGNTRVVHHSLVFEGDAGNSLNGLAGFFAGYVPGYDAVTYPSGTGKLLKKGQTFTFQMHYTTSGSAQTDQTEMGLYVSPVPPSYPLQTKSAFNLPFVLGLASIPANTRDFEMTAQYPSSGTLATDILLYEISPHMHLRGASFKYEAIYPSGAREVLASVPHYIFHWQALYRLTEPKRIPRGSRIVCTANWDNTTQNRELMSAYISSGNSGYLPNHSVNFAEQSWDEMFIGYMNYAEVP